MIFVVANENTVKFGKPLVEEAKQCEVSSRESEVINFNMT